MKQLNDIVLLTIITMLSFKMEAQLGIGTHNPTEELDVVGNVKIRDLISQATLPVSILSDGTLATVATNEASLGVQFIGFLVNDIPLADGEIYDIVLSSRFNPIGEFIESTNRFVPNSTGLYKVLIDFDIAEYSSTTIDVNITIGLWDFTDNVWETRGMIRHQNNNGTTIPREASYTQADFVTFTQGNSYGFRIMAEYGNSVSHNAILSVENAGTTGSSQATTISIRRVQ